MFSVSFCCRTIFWPFISIQNFFGLLELCSHITLISYAEHACFGCYFQDQFCRILSSNVCTNGYCSNVHRNGFLESETSFNALKKLLVLDYQKQVQKLSTQHFLRILQQDWLKNFSLQPKKGLLIFRVGFGEWKWWLFQVMSALLEILIDLS